ncbi:YdcF family protein [Mycobacterium sp. CBMA293]|uniref:YdcF family protein n=2 Tax=Mycolicibacterium TaxID=1866885 RepID=UPI0012DDC9DC|nr:MULTISPECIES: YdcF family protein [unclassified Mycolicibacterium]MUL46808.1 YdcF family protein [Mycolicibacterium sp. CBMA 360]MUL57407.1 YdcF family protein [Mycolicibacterium sp. CBMA 335]MUL70447.1 YdcF family protein [Mycolicibacterium sp. CBMA 311]MUL92495.1 YdcF family protein [Mycolicibacterium sp. CBMA 230]MUM04416.1 hypothetical protein [Mycolicibacterium sp. CBMA 213]
MPRGELGSLIRRVIAVIAIVVLVDVGVAGAVLFTNAKSDQLQHADAIVVLAGEHDGREQYGLTLARQGWAHTVVLSNPYPPGDPQMNGACVPAADIEVICRQPEVLTTRGEAMMVRQLSADRSWRRIIVVSWRYHLPRARLVFRQCYSTNPAAVVAVALPRRYDLSPIGWELMYFYQFAGFAKAAMQGQCS